MGVISPIGNNLTRTWQAALEGRSGIGPIDRFDASSLPVRIAGQAEQPAEEDALDHRARRRGDIHIFYGVAAARQAWRDAGLDNQPPDPERVGISVGSGIGGVRYLEEGAVTLKEEGVRRLSPFLIPGSLVNMAAGIIAIDLNLQGPSITLATACATGVHSIGLASRMIERGEADLILAGGAEASITPLSMGAFAQAKALSDSNESPQTACRPWDIDRNGFVMGEGSAILVLERSDRARARGAKIYAEVSGFGMSGDAYHMTAPDPSGRGAKSCMRLALKDASLEPGDVGYINAHATSTLLGDRVEAAAISEVFGAKKVPVNATKSLTGHLLGAAGALESLITVMSLRDQRIHPTINIDNKEEGIELDIVKDSPRDCAMQHALCNSFGFGGTNASLVFSVDRENRS